MNNNHNVNENYKANILEFIIERYISIVYYYCYS